MKPPCYQCRERSPTCHGTCERYAAFAAERKTILAERNAKKDADAAASDGIEKKIRVRLRTRRR